MQYREIRPGVVVSDQPTPDELRALAESGFAAVVNFRQEGEPEQPVGPAAEGEVVRGQGLHYVHHAVGGAPLEPEAVRALSRFLAEQEAAGGKVLLHCRKGGRAAALLLLSEAIREGWPADQVFARGEAMRLAINEPKLKALVAEYLASHVTA
jgi:uncharacterized protein (TIGR01244 family)